MEVRNMAEVKGTLFCNGAVEVLEVPYFDKTLQKWVALANAYGCLCFIELKVTPQVAA